VLPRPASAIILSRPFDLPRWLVPVISAVLPLVDGPSHVSKIAVSVLDSFWRSHRESRRRRCTRSCVLQHFCDHDSRSRHVLHAGDSWPSFASAFSVSSAAADQTARAALTRS
jgi:hypothetical protein